MRENLARVTIPETCSAATDEMHDLEAIVAGDDRRSPLTTGKKFQISLDGQPIGGKTQMSDEFSDVQPLRNLARFAVDLYRDRLAHDRIGYRVGRLGFSW